MTASRTARRQVWLVLTLALLLFAGSLYYASNFLEFQTDRADLIGSEDELYDDQEAFLEEFPTADDIVVLVEGGTSQRRQEYVNLLADLLEEHPERFYAVFPRLELPFLFDRALFFLEEDELQELVESLEEAKPFLIQLATNQGLDSLIGGFGSGGGSLSSDDLLSMLPLMSQVVEELRKAVGSRGRADYSSPWGSLFNPEGESELVAAQSGDLSQATFYHTLQDGRVHLLLLRLKETDPESIGLLRKTVQRAGKAYPDLSVGLTGEAVLEFDEMTSSEQDSNRSAVLSLILVGALFAVAFRQLWRPLAAIACLALGVGWTMGYTTWAVGHLNLLTISFATILIGLGIDFSIHLLFRYEEEFAKSGDSGAALDSALQGTGSDLTVGALSTATAFGAVGLTDFKGVSEIGVIAGGGILLCLASSLIVLPALITLMDRNRKPTRQYGLSIGGRIVISRSEEWLLSKAPFTLLAVVLFLVSAFPTVRTVNFDYNLLRLQDPTLESVMTELELIEKGGRTVLFAVALAEDTAQAEELKVRFESLSTVARVESVSELFPPRTERKVELLTRLQKVMEEVPEVSSERSASPGIRGAQLRSLGDGFLELQDLLEASKRGLAHQGPEFQKQFAEFENQLQRLFGELSGLGPGPIEDGLLSFQTNFVQDLAAVVQFLKAQDPDTELRLEDLPENLLIRSVGASGKIMVRVYPKENVWEREALDSFVREVRGAEPTAVGAPVMIWHHTTVLKRAFETSALYALAAVTLMLLIYFRSIRWTLLAMMPLALGIYVMLYAMGAADIAFNPANFMGLPLLLGIGLDFGIHALHRIKDEGRPNVFNFSTGPATALSGLTTMCGFGTLALGGHQGISSLGFVLAVGVGGIMVSALVVLPALLSVWPPFEAQESDAVEGS